MDLHFFGSFFEISAALNLTYAGSETFRHGLTEDLLWNSKTLTPRIINKNNIYKKKLHLEHQKLIVVASEPYGKEAYGNLQEKISYINANFEIDFDEFEKENKLIKEKELKGRDFYKGLQSAFFFAGLFSIYILLLEGYQQFYHSDDKVIDSAFKQSFSFCLFIFNFSSLVYIFFYFRSISLKWMAYPVKSFFIIITWLVFISISILMCILFPTLKYKIDFYHYDKWNITWAVFNAYLAFIIHLSRLFGRKFNYRFIKYKFWSFRFFCKYKILKFELNNIQYKISETNEVVFEIKHSKKTTSEKLVHYFYSMILIHVFNFTYRNMCKKKFWGFWVTKHT